MRVVIVHNQGAIPLGSSQKLEEHSSDFSLGIDHESQNERFPFLKISSLSFRVNWKWRNTISFKLYKYLYIQPVMKDEKAQAAVRLHDPVKLPEIKLRISMHLANIIKAFQWSMTMKSDTVKSKTSGWSHTEAWGSWGFDLSSSILLAWSLHLGLCTCNCGLSTSKLNVLLAWGQRKPSRGTALFTIAKTWKQPKCPSTDECINKMWYVYTMESYSAIKKNEIMPFAATWMDLDIIVLREVSQIKKNTIWYHLYAESIIWHKLTYLWNRNKTLQTQNTHL